MTDEKIKALAYTPLLDAWKVIHMTQHLKQNDAEEWNAYKEAHDNFCKKYGDEKYTFAWYLGMAIMAVVDDIAKLNREEDK